MKQKLKLSFIALLAFMLFIPSVMAKQLTDKELVGSWHYTLSSETSEVARFNMTFDEYHTVTVDVTVNATDETHTAHAKGVWMRDGDQLEIYYTSISTTPDDADNDTILFDNPQTMTIKSVTNSTLVLSNTFDDDTFTVTMLKN